MECRNYGRRWYDLNRGALVFSYGVASLSGAIVGSLITYIIMR